jgi:hypothetical protein
MFFRILYTHKISSSVKIISGLVECNVHVCANDKSSKYNIANQIRDE